MSLANMQGKLSRTEMKSIMAGSGNAPTCAGHTACNGGTCCWVQGSNWGYGRCNGASDCCEEAY